MYDEVMDMNNFGLPAITKCSNSGTPVAETVKYLSSILSETFPGK